MTTSKLLFVALAGATLTACGGGGGTSTPEATPVALTAAQIAEVYENPSTITEVSGVAIRIDTDPNASSVVTSPNTSGQFNTVTGAYQINEGTDTTIQGSLANNSFTANDPNDPNEGLLVFNQLGGVTYDYVYAYRYTRNSETAFSDGVIGTATDATHMPQNGSAIYNGHTVVTVNDLSSPASATTAPTTVSVDFAQASVDVSVTGVNLAFNGSTINTIESDNMTIDGSAFSGGTVTINGNAMDTVLGTNAGSEAQGQFFGYDATLAGPDEVGGVFLLGGTNGLVTGQFLAD